MRKQSLRRSRDRGILGKLIVNHLWPDDLSLINKPFPWFSTKNNSDKGKMKLINVPGTEVFDWPVICMDHSLMTTSIWKWWNRVWRKSARRMEWHGERSHDSKILSSNSYIVYVYKVNMTLFFKICDVESFKLSAVWSLRNPPPKKKSLLQGGSFLITTGGQCIENDVWRPSPGIVRWALQIYGKYSGIHS